MRHGLEPGMIALADGDLIAGGGGRFRNSCCCLILNR
jgi:hypothetical protein